MGIIHEYPGAEVVESGTIDGKLRFELIPPGPMTLLAEAFTVGAEKHGDRDWESAPKSVTKHLGSLLRHLYAFMRGENRDKDGQHHLASVAARSLMILELLEKRPEMDDRRV